MDGISRSRGWDKEIPHSVLLMEQLVLKSLSYMDTHDGLLYSPTFVHVS